MAAKTVKPKILDVSISLEVDENPDLSCLGKFVDDESEWVICVRHHDFVHNLDEKDKILETVLERFQLTEDPEEPSPRENFLVAADWLLDHDCLKAHERILREYLIPAPWRDLLVDKTVWKYYQPPDSGEEVGSPAYQQYAMQDYKRLRGYNSGEWWCVGVVAKAEVSIGRTGPGKVIHNFGSHGLWGIESDSDLSFFREVAEEELAALKQDLIAFNVNMRNWEKLKKETLKNIDKNGPLG